MQFLVLVPLDFNSILLKKLRSDLKEAEGAEGRPLIPKAFQHKTLFSTA